MGSSQMFLAQAGAASLGLAVVVIAVLANMVSSYDGAMSFIAWQLITIIIPVVTVCLAAIAGLPVRYIPVVRRWWIRNGEISVAGILVGWGFTVHAFLTGKEESLIEEGIHYTVHPPNWDSLLWGWCLLAFFITHFWIPGRWRRRARL